MQHSRVTRRQLMQGLGAVAAMASAAPPVAKAEAAQTPGSDALPYGPGVLPPGIRSRFVNNINGLRMHVLEAGFETAGRPAVLLLHGFPELAYSWRKVMLPIAAAGFHVDRSGCERLRAHVGHRRQLRRRPRAVPYAEPGQRHAGTGLRVRVPLCRRRDRPRLQGSPLAAWCSVVRPDVFRSVVMMSAPFGGPPALPFKTADAPPARRPIAPDADLRRARGVETAAKALPAVLRRRAKPTTTCGTPPRASTRSCARTTT